jgi:hypothetical protein
MVAWLEGEPGSVDVDVWGVKKANYSFVDLGDWLENGGKLELDGEDEELEKCKVLKRRKERKRTWKRGRRRERREFIRRRRAAKGQSK